MFISPLTFMHMIDAKKAIENDKIKTIELLIENGFDVNTIITEGKTPLILAAAHSRIEIAELLIDQGANVNVNVWKYGYGELPALRYSIVIGSPDLLELLIKGGANVNAQDSQGKTALYYAKDIGFDEITELLEDAVKTQAENEEAVKAQLAHSAPVGAEGGTSESEGDVEIEGEVTKEGDA